MKELIFLYGPPGAGKSAVGKLLAEALGLPFVDLDDEIVVQAQKSIPEIFAEDGEEHFRALEREELLGVLGKGLGVIALGGGAMLDPENRENAEAHGQVVCLGGSMDVLAERLKKSGQARPLVSGDTGERLKDLLSQRAEHYASFSMQCYTDNLRPEEVVWQVEKMTGWFQIKGMGSSYPARVFSGGLEDVGQVLAFLGAKGSVMVVTDSNVGPLYTQMVIDSLKRENFTAYQYTFPAGEAHKNLSTVSGLWGAFVDAKLDRGSTVIALGGGVVGDLSGFAAAAYMRGIDWVNLPTSLLAMVDSSVGGKTGFDLPQGKNLIGAFHSPRYVLVDPEVLVTLPEDELRSGMAEVVKHGVIGSPELLEQCANGLPDNAEEREKMVKEALAVKVKIIQDDPYEKGFRAVLNFGHTSGHAVELLSGFQIPHGEAVAIGMVFESQLAVQIGIADSQFVDRLTRILAGLGLPTKMPVQMNKAEILEVMQLDKKTTNSQIRFSLPEKVGKMKYGVVVDDLEEVIQFGKE